MNISKSYIKQCFKSESVQLSPESLEDIVRTVRVTISKMAVRCKEAKVKRLTPDIYYIALGRYSAENTK